MIAALHKAGDSLVVPDTLTIKKITEKEFENLLTEEAGKTYDNYGTIGRQLIEATAPEKKLSNTEQDRI